MILLLARTSPGVDRVDRRRAVLVQSIRRRLLVNLDLEAGVHGSPGRVGGHLRIDQIRRWQPWIAEAHKDARVVRPTVETELQPQAEVAEGLREEQQTDVTARMRDHDRLAGQELEAARAGLEP